MHPISPTGSPGGVNPAPHFKRKLQGIINRHYKSVPATTPVGCNLVIMQLRSKACVFECWKSTA